MGFSSQFGLRFIQLCYLLLANAQIHYSIGQNDLSSLRKACVDQLKNPSSLRDSYYSTKILSTLNFTDYKCSCSSISKLLTSSTSGFDYFYGIASGTNCGCSLELSSEAKNSIKLGLKSDELNILAGAALAAKVSGEKLVSMKDVVGKIKSLMEPDGTFKASPDGISSIESTRIALEVLTLYSDPSSKVIISEVIETVGKLLPVGDDDSVVDPLVLGFLATLSEDSKIKISPAQVNTVASSLLHLYHSRDIAVQSRSLESLSVIRTYASQPLHVSLSQTLFPLSANEKSFTIGLLDVFGNTVEPTSIEIKSIKKALAGKESSVYSGKLDIESGGSKVDLSGVSLSAGAYTVRITVIPKGRKSPITVDRIITITSEARVSDVYAGVTDNKQLLTSDLTHLKAQNSLSGYTASASSADYVHVSFTLSASKLPHQVFLKFTHLESNSQTYFVGREDDSGSSVGAFTYQISVSLADEVEKLLYLSGEYSLSILIGDVSMSAVEWVIGQLEVALTAKPKKEYPLYARSLLHTPDRTMEKLPEITHKMRGPPKQASAVASSVFTALAAVPLLVLIVFLLSLRPNLNRLQSIWSVLFTLCIGVALALYAAYWLAVPGASFYDTIKYICFLVPVTYIVGRSALASVTSLREKDNKKEF